MNHAALRTALLAGLLGACGGGGSSGGGGGAVSIPLDDIKDRSVHWNTHLVSPLVLAEDGSELYAINQGGQRLAIFDPATLAVLAEVPAGPGLVGMAQRPGTSELWLVDKITSAVMVLDLSTRTIVRSLRVGAEPHGIAFTPSGDRAYVACSGVDRVDVIEAAAFTLATSIPIPAKNPRAVVHHQGVAWVVPLISGNNTAPLGAAASGPGVDEIVDVRALSDFPGLAQLPDRDLLAIPTQAAPGLDQLDPSQTWTGLGTLLFNAHARPGTGEVWIPHTEALNVTHTGEKNFVAGQCVRNRIAVVDVGGMSPPEIVDLDALAPSGEECVQPTGLAFDPVRPRAYVCGYGSDRIAVLDLSGGAISWFGSIDVPFLVGYPAFAGPRTCVVDAAGDWLFVLNKGNTSLTRIDLNALPVSAGFAVTAPIPVLLGWDSVSGVERFGRNDLVNGKNSKSETTSCAACHVDGHTDGLIWNLGKFLDPEGTPQHLLAFPLDDKGPLVTQSVRRMFETGPYHWRGERGELNDFNQAFIDLMEREENGAPTHLGAHFKYLERYMKRVSYVPNPRQELDRSLTPLQQEGARLFTQKAVSGGATCATCHRLPLGTGGEITPSHVRGLFDMADVPQLRGVADKLTPAYVIGGAFGTRTELGAGLSHGGAFPTVPDLLLAPHPTLAGAPAFDLSAEEADAIAAFLSAFDTGLAPSTGFQATAHAGNAAGFAAAELAYLTHEAEAGRCDLIYRGAPESSGGTTIWPSGWYDPDTGAFRAASAGAPQVTIGSLLAEAAAGRPVTFIGVPLWMGLPLALDRDVDELYDLDELAAGTDPEHADTDRDTFPDGYELRFGMDPLAVDASSPDAEIPRLVGKPRLIYATTNTLKFELETSEACQLVVSYGGKAVDRLPLHPDFDVLFSVIVGELEADTDCAIELTLIDPAGNEGLETVSYRTAPLAFPAPVRVKDIALSILPQAGGADRLEATVVLRTGKLPPAPGYLVSADVHFEASFGALTPVATGVQELLTASDGTLTFQIDLPDPQPAPGKVHFVVRGVAPVPGQPPYARALNRETWEALTWN